MLDHAGRPHEARADGIVVAEGAVLVERPVVGILETPCAVNRHRRRHAADIDGHRLEIGLRFGAGYDEEYAVRGGVYALCGRGIVVRAERADRIGDARIGNHLEPPVLEIRLDRHGDLDVLAVFVQVAVAAVVSAEDVRLVDPRPAGRNRIKEAVRRERLRRREIAVEIDAAVPIGLFPLAGGEICSHRLFGVEGVVFGLQHVLHNGAALLLGQNRLDVAPFGEATAEDELLVGALGEIHRLAVGLPVGEAPRRVFAVVPV